MKNVFKVGNSSKLVTSDCEKITAEINGRHVTVIDTPGLFNNEITNEEIHKKIKNYFSKSPKPDAFLSVTSVGHFNNDHHIEVIKLIQDTFGENAMENSMVLFTCVDQLAGRTIEQYLLDKESTIHKCVDKYGYGYHQFNNTQTEYRYQVLNLLDKIDKRVAKSQMCSQKLEREKKEDLEKRQERKNDPKPKEQLGMDKEKPYQKLKTSTRDDRYNETITPCKEKKRKETKDDNGKHKRQKQNTDLSTETANKKLQDNKNKNKEYTVHYFKNKEAREEIFIERGKESLNVNNEQEPTMYKVSNTGEPECNEQKAKKTPILHDKKEEIKGNETSEAEMKKDDDRMTLQSSTGEIEENDKKTQKGKKDQNKDTEREHKISMKEQNEQEPTTCEVSKTGEPECFGQIANIKPILHDKKEERKGNETDEAEMKKDDDRMKIQSSTGEMEENAKLTQEGRNVKNNERESKEPVKQQEFNREKSERLENEENWNEKLKNVNKQLKMNEEQNEDRSNSITTMTTCYPDGDSSVQREENTQKSKQHESVENEQITNLFNRLNLKNSHLDKLTTADILQLTKFSLHWQEPQDESELVYAFLRKLMRINYMTRYTSIKHKEKYYQINCTNEEKGHKIDETSYKCENQSEINFKIHPMDVQMAVFHCADSFLKQLMVTKLSQCQYALPLLVPDPFTQQLEFPLWTFRQINKSWNIKNNNEIITKTQPVCKAATPMVAFFRFGLVSSSKSELMNKLINEKHNTFFHRNCKGSSTTRVLMDGVVEIAWYCPSGKDTDTFTDCVAFCNLHGDAGDHDKQLNILAEMASVNVVLLPQLDRNDRNDKNAMKIQKIYKDSKTVICLLDKNNSALTEMRKGKYKIGLKDRNQSEVMEELVRAINDGLSLSSTRSCSVFRLEDVARFSEIRVDEHDHDDCRTGKEKAQQMMSLLEKTDLTQSKELLLPCQGKLWHQWCQKNKELHQPQGDETEIDISRKKTDLEKIRKQQHASDTSEFMTLFLKEMNTLNADGKVFFLKWLGILLDQRTSEDLSALRSKYNIKCSEILKLKKNNVKPEQLAAEQTELKKISEDLHSANFGLVHILREIGQIYESCSSVKNNKDGLQCHFSSLPSLAAEMMISGFPLELMDGDASHVSLIWVTAVFDELVKKLGDQRVFVLSVLGIQSTGKSTLLNTMFGLQFAVSAGRCTRGAFMQLVKVSDEMKTQLKFDYILVVDTEGLCSLELSGRKREIMTMNWPHLLQNVSDITAKEKNMEGKRKLLEELDEMTELAAKDDVCEVQCFKDVIKFDALNDVKYCAQLWEGNPPMAPPNPNYNQRTSEDLSALRSKYNIKCSEILKLKKNKGKPEQLAAEQTELKKISEDLHSANFGLVHILREIGQIYESCSSVKNNKDGLQCHFSSLPSLAAEMMISGFPLELMDGDASHVSLIWVTAVFDELVKKLGDQRVFVLSVLGIQSTGKSTLLNTMFGLQFAVSAGRCTRGAFMQLVKVSDEMKTQLKFDYILVVDTEGLCSLELSGRETRDHDNELATFVAGLGNLTLINVFGESLAEMQNILQIVVHAFLRMKQVKLNPSCIFVHQNVSDITAKEKNMEGKRKLLEELDEMTELAAKDDVCEVQCFKDVIKFDALNDVKYCAQLWEGNPPMAPPNPNYSENVNDLKETIFFHASQSDGIMLTQLKQHMQDLCEALLNERFVFSFKNSLEVANYRKLETEYSQWSWNLKNSMMEIENKLLIKIENGLINTIKDNDFEDRFKEMSEVNKHMSEFFKKHKNASMLFQWKAFEIKIKELQESIVSESKRKLNEVLKQRDINKKINDQRTHYENIIYENSKQLALTLKDTLKDTKILEEKFDSSWKMWVNDIRKDTPALADSDPVLFFESKKEVHYNIFQKCCEGATSCAIFGQFICNKLKETIQQSVYKKTARDLANEMRSNCESLNGNRSKLEKHILKVLAEEEKFDMYVSYIHNPRDLVESFIRDEVSKYISEKFSVSVLQKIKEGIKLHQQKIIEAAHEASKLVKVKNDVDSWLNHFTNQLSDVLMLSEKIFTGVSHNDVDINLLVDVIRRELPSVKFDTSRTEVVNFLGKLDYKDRPDEILIDHLCQCCWVTCPFCKAICTNTIENHGGDHSVPFHRNVGLNGWYFRGTNNLSVDICTSKVASNHSFFPNASDNIQIPWREYRKGGPKYANWSITPDLSELPYWKWVVCRFQKDLENKYNKRFLESGKIPGEWRKYTKQEAIESLNKHY
ncbi:interferon-induced very large GTPase 1-like [Onychostoma macrolepis]|uniref:interferon-induced very large GTPase 1-like n=1 Tax=Onychostoma macrolepis TaxID=369639 RepID=UPI00272A450A|nr:interferon-induced very large GTPase 1-like [Onychostoma macrolepis]